MTDRRGNPPGVGGFYRWTDSDDDRPVDQAELEAEAQADVISEAHTWAAVDQRDAAIPEPWRMEVLAKGERAWATNTVRYRTREAALAAGEDLAGRWTLVRYWRAVDETVPLRQAYVEGSEDGRAEQ
jgi:hypothetical protein